MQGWASGRRFLAAILTVFLLSLIGIPITGGFFAKFYVFSAALQGAHSDGAGDHRSTSTVRLRPTTICGSLW